MHRVPKKADEKFVQMMGVSSWGIRAEDTTDYEVETVGNEGWTRTDQRRAKPEAQYLHTSLPSWRGPKYV